MIMNNVRTTISRWFGRKPKEDIEDQFSKVVGKIDEVFDETLNSNGLVRHEEYFLLRNLTLRAKRLSAESFSGKKAILPLLKEILFAVKYIQKYGDTSNTRKTIMYAEAELDLHERKKSLFRFIFFVPKFRTLLRKAYFSDSLVTKITTGLYVSSFISLLLLTSTGLLRTVYSSLLGASKQFFLEDAIYFERLNLRELERELRELQGFQELETNRSILQELDTENQEIMALDTTINQRREAIIRNAIAESEIEIRELGSQLQNSGYNPILDEILIIIIVLTAGTLGSIISIFTRVQEFDRDRKNFADPLTPVLVGVFKPLIGAAFAFFLYALISSEMITTNLFDEEAENRPNRIYAFISVAFVAGFSERLVRDLIEDTAGRIGGQPVVSQLEREHSQRRQLEEKPHQEELHTLEEAEENGHASVQKQKTATESAVCLLPPSAIGSQH